MVLKGASWHRKGLAKARELWDSLETKYMAEDESRKKFIVSNFNNYKMVDSRNVMEQYNELLRILYFKQTIKYKEELTHVEFGSHLRIDESLRAYNDNKSKRKHHDNYKLSLARSQRIMTLRGGLTLELLFMCARIYVPKDIRKEVVVQQHEFRMSKRNMTPKNFGPEFQLYLIEGIRDEVFDQPSYCFDVEDDPKTFNEAMKYHDVAF
uniref:Zinc finger, CCHC-type n=1 Tax=Tanacetum cinerariifolium TaxID=118510 RepID=A0A6L2NB87_TANCI|nr:zinc finger, CCHC-type [Tanacetum cinerariifolium]